MLKIKSHNRRGMDFFDKFIIDDKKLNATSVLLFSSLLIVFLGVQILPWENSIITIHDNLDSNHVYYKVLIESGLLYRDGNLDSFLGFDRNAFPSELNLATQMYNIFPPLTAYFTILVLKVFISVLGMYLCLTSKLIKLDKVVAFGVGCAFAFLPGHPASYLAQASVPLICYLVYLFALNKSNKIKDTFLVFTLLIIPSISSFALYCVYLLSIISFISLYLFFKRNYILSSRLIFALAILSIGYIICDYRLFELQLNQGYLSIREEMVKAPIDFISQLKTFSFKGQYHSESFPIHIYITLLIVFFIKLRLTLKTGSVFLHVSGKLFYILLLMLSYILIFSSFSMTEFFLKLSEQFKVLNLFNWSRFTFLLATVLYFILGCFLVKFDKKTAVFLIITLSIVNLTKSSVYNDFIKNVTNLVGLNAGKPTYHDFYDVSAFEQLKSKINYNNEKSISIGFHPAVLTYNNIKTIDGYFSYAPLDYKRRFREFIEPQLEVNEKHRNYFDNWGGRMYFFENSDKYKSLGYECEPLTLNININALKKSSLKYVFSACEIKNATSLELKLLYKIKSRNYKVFYTYSLSDYKN